MERSRERSSALHLGVAIKKGAFGSPPTMVANFTYYFLIFWEKLKIFFRAKYKTFRDERLNSLSELPRHICKLTSMAVLLVLAYFSFANPKFYLLRLQIGFEGKVPHQEIVVFSIKSLFLSSSVDVCVCSIPARKL